MRVINDISAKMYNIIRCDGRMNSLPPHLCHVGGRLVRLNLCHNEIVATDHSRSWMGVDAP